MGRSILYRCSQREYEPSLKKGQCLEDVILSTVNLERQAGLNSACEFKATLESFSKLGGGGCRIEAGSERCIRTAVEEYVIIEPTGAKRSLRSHEGRPDKKTICLIVAKHCN